MSPEITADVLLRNYLDGFLWADEEWLEVDGATATYWQARLPQTTTVEVLPDGHTKWQTRTRIVENVADGTDAALLCLELNRHAAGWSFACNAADRTVDAIAAISAPLQWDTFFLRLSEKAKLSAWMSDVIAERLAETLGGKPAFSHPTSQSGIRQHFDGTYHYLEMLRGRPEWILDLTRYEFPPVEEVGSTIAELVGAPTDALWSDGTELRIMLGPRMGLSAGFDQHPIFGPGWRSSLIVPPRSLSGALAEHLSAMTWALFDDPETNLLGGWSLESDGLTFRQWNTMSEVRNQEQLGSYDGHLTSDLWGFTSTLSDVLGLLSAGELPEGDGGNGSDVANRAEVVVAAIAEQARPAVTEPHDEGDGPADRRLLWLEHRRTIVVAAWFNPMGPTVSSTEVCALPDGTEYLVHCRRHPLSPFYSVLGPIGQGSDQRQLEQAANDLLIGDASLPNVLFLWERPDAPATEVPALLRDRVITIAENSGEDLAGQTAWIAQTMGSPWEFAAFDQSEAEQVQAAASAAAAANPEPDHGFATWWQLVSSVENVTANFRCLPDAWDGTINTQNAFGNLPLFDPGPLPVTYSKIGMPGPDGSEGEDS